MKYCKYLLACAFCVNVQVAYGGVNQCELRTARDVLNCALTQSPEILRVKADSDIADLNQQLSRRWLAPELDGELGYNRDDAENKGIAVDLAILQPIEMPKTRRARRTKATVEASYAQLLLEEQRETVATQVLTILNRLRQIHREKQVLDTMLQTFTQVIGRYQKRPVLSPEDQISLELLQLASRNDAIAKNQLANEESLYVSQLQALLNTQVVLDDKLFYYPPLSWPVLEAELKVDASLDLYKDQLAVQRAEAEHLAAQGSSLSELRVGPYIQTRPGDAGEIESYGIRFSMPLPIYSSKKQAGVSKIAVHTAQQQYAAKQFALSHELQSLRAQYVAGVAILQQYWLQNLEAQRRKIDKAFRAGRVSNALLIESYRQMFESLQVYHQYELSTLQNLWRLYALQRKLLANIEEVAHAKL